MRAGKSDEHEDKEEKRAVISAVRIYDIKLRALMEISATPNVLSLQVIGKLSLKPKHTSKMVTVAAGGKYGAFGKLTTVHVLFDDWHAEVNFIILRNVPFDVVFERLKINRLGCVLDFPAELVRFQ